jgi:predicted HTH transcriptional regulator
MSSHGNITLKHLEMILEYVAKRGSITNRECRELTGLSYDQGIKIGSAMCILGMLKRQGEGRVTKYIAPPIKEILPQSEGFHRGSRR